MTDRRLYSSLPPPGCPVKQLRVSRAVPPVLVGGKDACHLSFEGMWAVAAVPLLPRPLVVQVGRLLEGPRALELVAVEHLLALALAVAEGAVELAGGGRQGVC